MTSFLLPSSWQIVLQDLLQEKYMLNLRAFLEAERLSGQEIYPQEEHIFTAFSATPFHNVKVVIVGQDPYHGPGQAHGLSFSVQPGVTPPPSLKNIYKELEQDLQIPQANHGCLLKWANEGVLLLNAILTVRKGEPMSHAKRGWESFTTEVLRIIAKKREHVVFILWGKSAQEKCASIHELGAHLVLQAAHPSPYSASNGFFGCRHFSKTNNYLKENGITPIDWRLSSGDLE